MRKVAPMDLEKVAGGVAQTPDRWAGEDGKGGCLTNEPGKALAAGSQARF